MAVRQVHSHVTQTFTGHASKLLLSSLFPYRFGGTELENIKVQLPGKIVQMACIYHLAFLVLLSCQFVIRLLQQYQHDDYLFCVFLHPLEFNLLESRNWVFFYLKYCDTHCLPVYLAHRKLSVSFLNEWMISYTYMYIYLIICKYTHMYSIYIKWHIFVLYSVSLFCVTIFVQLLHLYAIHAFLLLKMLILLLISKGN